MVFLGAQQHFFEDNYTNFGRAKEEEGLSFILWQSINESRKTFKRWWVQNWSSRDQQLSWQRIHKPLQIHVLHLNCNWWNKSHLRWVGTRWIDDAEFYSDLGRRQDIERCRPGSHYRQWRYLKHKPIHCHSEQCPSSTQWHQSHLVLRRKGSGNKCNSHRHDARGLSWEDGLNHGRCYGGIQCGVLGEDLHCSCWKENFQCHKFFSNEHLSRHS